MTIRNDSGISLSLSVWLVHDEYDYNTDANYISVTGLMKPLRHIILPNRIPPEKRVMDVEDFIATALGHSLHDSIEKAWKHGNHVKNLKKLGYPADVISRVLVNPADAEVKAIPDCIPVYLEQRAFREVTVNGITYKIGGKFDMVAEGIVHDNKSTSAYSWLYGTRDDEHALQGSLYRWLNPDKITEDFIRINYIFTDWQKMMARTNPNYPQKRVLSKEIPLMTIAETEQWVKNKLALVQKYTDTPEPLIPECTNEELWRSDPKYKYFSDPANVAGKSTKNFDSLREANQHKMEKGKGIVITVPGEAKRCGFCNAYDICTQKDRLL